MKQCTKCKQTKGVREFYQDYSKSDKLRPSCKVCDNKVIARYKANPKYKIRWKPYFAAWQRQYRQTEKYRTWRKKAELIRRKRLQEAKAIIVNHYGGKCACCDVSDICFLTIDHINNDGYKLRKNNKYRSYGLWYYRKIIASNFPLDLQILCFNCNIAKAHNGGVCPHKHQTLRNS